MTYHLDRLIHPENYSEKEIQGAIEHYWPCLFRRYQLHQDLKHTVMPMSWQPDLLAAETESAFGSALIVELKGSPPAGSLSKAVEQVVTYGQRYNQERPGERIRLLVIGPWKQARLRPTIKRHGYSVLVWSLQQIGIHLAQLADDLLMWSVESPLGRPSLHEMESAIWELPTDDA